MKRIKSLIVCSLLCIPFWACSSIEGPEEMAVDTATQTVKKRTVDEAIQIANRWTDKLFPATSRSSRTTSATNVKCITLFPKYSTLNCKT